MNQPKYIERHCRIQKHNSSPIVYICTDVSCKGNRFMCTDCLLERGRKYKDCLSIDSFHQVFVKDKNKYILNQRKQHVENVLEQFQKNKMLFLQHLDEIEQLFKSVFNRLQQEEIEIQELYTQITNYNGLQLSKDNLNMLLTLHNDKESEAFQSSQADAFIQMKAINTQLCNQASQLTKIAAVQHGKVIEKLSNNDNLRCEGEYRLGVKFGKWIIRNEEDKVMYCVYQLSGGGSYNYYGKKHGKWIDVEIDEDSTVRCHQGEYDSGNKINKWYIKDEEDNVIGEDDYNQPEKRVENNYELQKKIQPGMKNDIYQQAQNNRMGANNFRIGYCQQKLYNFRAIVKDKSSERNFLPNINENTNHVTSLRSYKYN